MKKTGCAVLVLLVMTVGIVYAYDDGDFQVWNTEVQEFKINKKSKIALEEEFRWADNANDFFYHHYDAGCIYNVSDFLNLGAGYRHVLEKKRGKFKRESEPYMILGLSWQWLGFKFNDRSRLEYRHFEYQVDSWRYRNRLTVNLPWKFTKFQIQPFVSDEIFLNFYNTAFTKNRVSAGLAFSLTKNLKGEIYYMLESSKSSHKWSDANVLGTKIKLSF